MNLKKLKAKELGEIIHRWRTADDCVFYEDKIIDAIWGPNMGQRVRDFESGENVDFRIWWGFIVWCDDLNLSFVGPNHWALSYIKMNDYLTEDEHEFLKEYHRRIQGTYKRDQRIEVYKQMLEEGL